MKYLVLLLILVGFSGSAFAQYMGDISDAGIEKSFPTDRRIGHTQALDATFELKNREYAKIPTGNLMITFLEVVEDSRCPTDVVCVWQGTASIYVNMRNNEKDFGNHIIPLGATLLVSPQKFDGYFIRLIKLEPYAVSNPKIIPSEYVATMLVGKVNDMSAYSPLKQFKSGIAIDQIQCKENLYLAYKSSDGAPICVKLETGKKLLERGFVKCMETKTENSRVNLCGIHTSVDGNPNPVQETNSNFNLQKIQNKFPNVAQRQVVMKIHDQRLQDGALGITIIDKITRIEPSDDVVYIEIVKQWENFKIPEPMFFNITLEGDDTPVSKPFLIQQSLMESHAGPLKDQFYFSLPVNVPLLAKAKQGVTLFNYTMPDILPKDDRYHLKFASFSDVEVELPQNTIIIENNTREYSEFWSYDEDYVLTHKAGYLTISYPGNSFDVNNVIIYDITFEIRK